MIWEKETEESSERRQCHRGWLERQLDREQIGRAAGEAMLAGL